MLDNYHQRKVLRLSQNYGSLDLDLTEFWNRTFSLSLLHFYSKFIPTLPIQNIMYLQEKIRGFK